MSATNTPPTDPHAEARKRIMAINGVGFALAVGMTAGAYFLGIEPRLAMTAQLYRDQAAAAVRENDAQAQTISVATARRKLRELTERAEATAIRLEPPEQINGRLEAVTQLAERHEVGIDQLGPGQVMTDSRHVRIPIRVAGTTSYAAFAALIADVRARFPDTAVREFTLTAPAGGLPGRAGYTLDLLWYAAPPGTDGSTARAGGADGAGRAVTNATPDGASR